jgi:hypothetical protein
MLLLLGLFGFEYVEGWLDSLLIFKFDYCYFYIGFFIVLSYGLRYTLVGW